MTAATRVATALETAPAAEPVSRKTVAAVAERTAALAAGATKDASLAVEEMAAAKHIVLRGGGNENRNRKVNRPGRSRNAVAPATATVKVVATETKAAEATANAVASPTTEQRPH